MGLGMGFWEFATAVPPVLVLLDGCPSDPVATSLSGRLGRGYITS